MMSETNIDAASQKPAPWQIVLQKIIQSSRERQRLAIALGVNIVTLSRWVKGESHPQRSYLARLAKVVQPEYRSEMLKALLQTFPEMRDRLIEEVSEIVPSSFYRQILKDQASIIETQLSWRISYTVFEEGLKLLDPHQEGMAITAALCMPPVDGKIRTLREHGGRGHAPWNSDLEQKAVFLGLNSLAGYVVLFGKATSVLDVKAERYIPVFPYPPDWENSAGAAPIWLHGRIAGCLLAASTQIEHFTQERMDLLNNLANVFTLALKPAEFYDHQLVQLRYVPHPTRQQDLLKSFRQRVSRLMTTSVRQGQPLSSVEAEQAAWRDIEDELLNMGLTLDEDETLPGHTP